MTNRILTVLEDVGKVIAWPFVHLSRTISILQTTMKDYPAVRTAVVGLVTQVQTVAVDASAAAAADELNPELDAAELAAAVTLFKYCRDTFLPQVEAAYKDEVNAATGAAQAAAAASAAKSAAATKAAATRAAKAQASGTATSPAATSGSSTDSAATVS